MKKSWKLKRSAILTEASSLAWRKTNTEIAHTRSQCAWMVNSIHTISNCSSGLPDMAQVAASDCANTVFHSLQIRRFGRELEGGGKDCGKG